jgi:hypothetical protein
MDGVIPLASLRGRGGHMGTVRWAGLGYGAGDRPRVSTSGRRGRRLRMSGEEAR